MTTTGMYGETEEDKLMSVKTVNVKNVLPLELHELLDRYELLYSDVERLSDLRRAVVDRDLSSIFRLSEPNEDLRRAVVDGNLYAIFKIMQDFSVTGGHSDDLRRAVLEKNLYSLFRLYSEEDETVNLYRTAIVNKNLRSIFKLVNNVDLRKVCLDQNYWKLWPILESFVDTQFTTAFKSFYVNNTEIDPDCFSRGQLRSKQWLVDELKKCDVELGTVFLCAGWYATLATMLFESDIKVDKIRSFDLDPGCVDVAEVFNKPWFVDQWRFKSITQDIMDVDYDEHTWQYWSNANNRMSYPIVDSPDTIINTSCEHIPNFAEWYAKIPSGKLVVLQSNDFYEVKEHVNCVGSIEEFAAKAPMQNILYSGELDLPKYKRFMLIGYR